MLKKFLCVFAMALLLVACDGKSGKKISDDDDDDDKKEFNTGYAVLDDGLERLNKVCKKVKKVETLYELEELEDEFYEVGSKWKKENEEELQKLENTEAEDIFDEEYEKIMKVFHKKRAKLRENSGYGRDSVCEKEKEVVLKEPYYYDAVDSCKAEPYYYYEQEYYADSARATYDYYDEPIEDPYYY